MAPRQGFSMTRWHILAILFLARVGMGFQFQTLASVGDDLVVAHGLDYAEIGLLIGLFMAPGVFLALPMGLSGRFMADRWFVALGFGLLALGGIVSGAASDGWTIGFGRVIAGAGFLVTTLYLTKMVADWFDGREIATAMSLFVMSWPFGIAMGQVGHVWLADIADWRAPFMAASAYCALAAIAIAMLYRPPGPAKTATGRAETALSGVEWRLILLAGIAWATYNTGYIVFLSFGPAHLMAEGMPDLAAAGIISIASWLMILSGAVCGLIVDRLGHRTLVLAVCMASAVAALLLLGFTSHALIASLLFGLVGVAPAGVIMAMGAGAVRPDRRAFAMGVFFMIYFAMLLSGPPIAGAILDATGKPNAALLFSAGLFTLVVPTAIAYGAIKKRDRAP